MMNKDAIKSKIERIQKILSAKQQDRNLENLKKDLIQEIRSIILEKPKDGYTPIKGKDYFDGLPGYTPVKGKDYFDGKDGKTPVKGKDYFDGKDGKTPIKGKDYFTDSEIKMIIDLAMSGFKITSKQIIDLISDQKIKYEDRLSVLALKDLNKLSFASPGGVAQPSSTGGVTSLSALTDVNLAGLADGNMLVYDSATSKWIVAIPTDTDEKVKLNASDPTAGYLDDKVATYGFLTDISGQDLSTADNSTSQFITLADVPAEADTLQTVTDRGATTTNSIEALSFITTGGTSSDFVKGDGSLDSSTYLTTESDPVFSASQAANITSQMITDLGNLNISNWDTAYGWGNHASAGYELSASLDTDVGSLGYIKSVAFADLTDYPSDTAGVLTNDGAGNLSWEDTAVSWGNITGSLSSQTDLYTVINRLQDNIAVTNFRLQAANSLAIYNMVDAVSDEYEDETGIDSGSSSNQNYNSANDYYSSTSVDVSTDMQSHWLCNDNAASTTVLDNYGSFNGTVTGGHNTSDLNTTGKINDGFLLNGSSDYLNMGDLQIDGNDFSLFFWLKLSSLSSDSWLFYFGDPSSNGNYYYMSVSTAGLLTLGVRNGPQVGGVSDSTTHPTTITTGTWFHIGVVRSGSTATIYVDNVANTPKTGTGFAASLGTNHLIGAFRTGIALTHGIFDDIRLYDNDVAGSIISAIYGSGAGTESEGTIGGDMTLVSETFTAESEPTTARMLILEEDVDSITVNTDIKAYVTKDGGSTWDLLSLTDEGDYDTDKRLLVAETTLSSTGTSMGYKITTSNGKNLKLHATNLSWQ